MIQKILINQLINYHFDTIYTRLKVIIICKIIIILSLLLQQQSFVQSKQMIEHGDMFRVRSGRNKNNIYHHHHKRYHAHVQQNLHKNFHQSIEGRNMDYSEEAKMSKLKKKKKYDSHDKWKNMYEFNGKAQDDYDDFHPIDITLEDIGAEQRIMGGRYAMLGEFPYIISLRFKNKHICGGSIVRSDLIITAAHCVKKENIKFYSILPNYNNFRDNEFVKVYKVAKVLTPKRRNQFSDDYAFLKLTEQIVITKSVDIVRMPTSAPVVGDAVYVAGWGTDGTSDSVQLRTVAIPIQSSSICIEQFGNDFGDGMICAGLPGLNSCPGDSGGPLIRKGSNPHRDVLIGIVSWGPVCGRNYAVYTNIWVIKDAIRKLLKENGELVPSNKSTVPTTTVVPVIKPPSTTGYPIQFPPDSDSEDYISELGYEDYQDFNIQYKPLKHVQPRPYHDDMYPWPLNGDYNQPEMY